MALSYSPIYTMDFSSKEPFCLEAVVWLTGSQKVALDLAGGSLGKFGDESKVVGTLKSGHARAQPAVDFAVEAATRTGHAGPQDDVRHRFY